ncbi:hypothetical protein GQX74_010590 [Glossina fuscipes]|nr:hypothetical protein GQX74_010590 [Glossina fuscipes]
MAAQQPGSNSATGVNIQNGNTLINTQQAQLVGSQQRSYCGLVLNYADLGNKIKNIIRTKHRRYFMNLFGNADSAVLWRILRKLRHMRYKDNVIWDGEVNHLNSFFVVDHSLGSELGLIFAIYLACATKSNAEKKVRKVSLKF